ncbi:hypothetical protein EVAR_10517_1 [Eumeta japonica]|uniref:Uncharacterized protein n=1 Tax=Eumeta variegata TaxID=151549 RepID=A0A4C1TKI6_EUMVA|nr:hypothetical protein EVAR_10517_1 [Eumeta japonica]
MMRPSRYWILKDEASDRTERQKERDKDAPGRAGDGRRVCGAVDLVKYFGMSHRYRSKKCKVHMHKSEGAIIKNQMKSQSFRHTIIVKDLRLI